MAMIAYFHLFYWIIEGSYYLGDMITQLNWIVVKYICAQNCGYNKGNQKKVEKTNVVPYSLVDKQEIGLL